MDVTTTASVGRRRLLAFRFIAGVLGSLLALTYLAYTLPALTDDKEKVHSFHNFGPLPVWILLLALPLVTLAIRPSDVVALRIAWAVAIANVIAPLFGQDFISGTYFIVPVAVIVLTILAPTRSELLRFGSPNIAMLSLAIIAALPAIVYAWHNARIMLQGDPATDMTGHWKNHHWSGVAIAPLALVLAGIAVSFRQDGDRMWVWLVGISAMLFGVAGIVFADDLVYPSSIGTLWGIGVLFAGIVYIVVGEVTGKERTA